MEEGSSNQRETTAIAVVQHQQGQKPGNFTEKGRKSERGVLRDYHSIEYARGEHPSSSLRADQDVHEDGDTPVVAQQL